MDMEKTIAYIRANRDNLEAIRERMLEFAAESSPMTLRNFFVRCNKLKLPATALAYYTMLWLAENDKVDVIESLFSSTTPENAFYGVYAVGKAFADFRSYDAESGARHLREGIYHSLYPDFKNIPDQDLLMRNAFLLEDLEWPGEERFPKPIFEVLHKNPFGDSSYTCAVACDPNYYERHFAKFAKSLRDRCGNIDIFLLLIDPDDKVVSDAMGYDGVTIAKTEHDGRWRAEFRSLSMLMMANEILRTTDNPTIFMDADAISPSDSDKFLTEISKLSIGLYETGEVLPTNMISSKLLVSHHDDRAKAFWDTVEEFVSRGFARKGPLVGLGQTALLVAASKLRAGGFSVPEINAALNREKNLLRTFYAEEAASVCDKVDEDVSNQYFRAKSMTPGMRVDIAEEENPRKKRDQSIKYKNISLPWDLSEDTEKLVKFIDRNKRDHGRMMAEILNFSDKANGETLNNLFMGFRNIPELKPADLTYYALRTMVEEGKGDKVSAVFEASNANNPFWGLYSIAQSFQDCTNWEIEACANNMREGLYHCLVNRVNFNDLSFIIQNVYLLEEVTWPGAERFQFPKPIASLAYSSLFDNSPYSVFTGFSPEYVERYLDERLKNIRDECGPVNIIIHLVNPDEKIIGQLRGVSGIAIMETHYCGKYVSEYWAASLFRVTKEFSNFVNQPIVFAELDSLYPKGIKEIFEYITTQSHVPYCDVGDLYPILKIDGGLAAYNRNDECSEFYDIGSDFMERNYMRKGPIYLADQLARYQAVCIGKRRGWNMTDINKFMKGRYRYFFKGEPEGEHPLPLEERWETRSNSKYTFGGMTHEKRLIWIPTPEKQEELPR